MIQTLLQNLFVQRERKKERIYIEMFTVYYSLVDIISFISLFFITIMKHLKLHNFIKKTSWSGLWWFEPVILVTQEAEIRRIMVRSPILKISNTKKDWWSGSRCRP
jgi:hypothetical protein